MRIIITERFPSISALKIHCSGECKSLLDKLGGYELVERGLVPMKVRSGRGIIDYIAND